MKLLKRRKYTVTSWDLDSIIKLNIIKRIDPSTMKVTGENIIELTTNNGEVETIAGEWSQEQLEAIMSSYLTMKQDENRKNFILEI